MRGRAVARAPGSAIAVALAAALALGLALLPADSAWAGSHQASGNGSARIHPFAEVDVTDSSVGAFALSPSTGDPGPRAFSTADGFAFTNGDTNVRSVLTLQVTSATNGASSSTATVQGTAHTIADWVYAAQDGNAIFGSVRAVGVFDPNAAAYTPPGGFSAGSQGTLTVRTYATPNPADNGATATVNWIYDPGANKFMLDGTDKHFSNGNGERIVWPVSEPNRADYTFTSGGNDYAVVLVANAGSNYVPTVHMGWKLDWNNQGPVTKQAYVLLDVPSGAPRDTYSFTLTATIAKTK